VEDVIALKIFWVVIDRYAAVSNVEGEIEIVRQQCLKGINPIVLRDHSQQLKGNGLPQYTLQQTIRARPAEYAHQRGVDRDDQAAPFGRGWASDWMK